MLAKSNSSVFGDLSWLTDAQVWFTELLTVWNITIQPNNDIHLLKLYSLLMYFCLMEIKGFEFSKGQEECLRELY